MKIFLVFIVVGNLVGSIVRADNDLVCQNGSLKVARCTSSIAATLAAPVQQVLVCQNPDVGYAMQSLFVTPNGSAAITPTQAALARRLNNTQVLYSSEQSSTALVLNGDRQSGTISVCDPTAQNCMAKAAICE